MSSITLISLGVLILILIPIVVIDIRQHRIPNLLNAILAAAGLLAQAVTATSFHDVARALIAPVAIIAVFLGIIALMKLLRRPGTLGLGDVKFLGAASLWVGFVGSTAVFVIASLLSLVFVLARSPWRAVRFRQAIAFGPFLAAGLLIVFAFLGPPHPTGETPQRVAAGAR